MEKGMTTGSFTRVSFGVLFLISVLLAGCAGTKTGAAPPSQALDPGGQQAVAAAQNPAGDIPDTQTFVSYNSASGGYVLDVPEGWARTENGGDVRFVSTLDGVEVTLSSAASAPTAASARGNEVAALQKSGRAVQVRKVQDVQLSGGPAVLVDYTSNSGPDPVTDKQVRLENNAYLFFKNGKLATLTLWAPLGADNVDQWQRMAKSFRWQ